MKTAEKKTYLTPQLDYFEFEVENGISSSTQQSNASSYIEGGTLAQ